MLLGYIPVLAVTVTVVCTVKFLWSRRHLYKLSWQLPGPTGLPFIGSGLYFLVKQEDILKTLSKLIVSYGSPMKCWVGTHLFVVFRDPKNIEVLYCNRALTLRNLKLHKLKLTDIVISLYVPNFQNMLTVLMQNLPPFLNDCSLKILTSNKFNNKFDTYECLSPLIGDGLISGSGPKHRDHRKLIQPLLGPKFSNECFHVFEQKMNMMLAILDQHVNKKSFDIEDALHRLITDVVGITILGTELNTLKGKNNDFLNALAPTQKYAHNQIVKPWCRIKILYNLTELGQVAMKSMRIIHKEINLQIERAFSAIKSNSLNGYKLGNENSIVYELALASDKNLIDKKDLIWELSTLHVASEDTITLNLAFACLCFGLYPEYQQKAANEIISMFGETEIVYEDLPKLKYLDMCIKEIFRLFPIGPYILRKSVKDFHIDGLFYPKEVGIMIPIFDIHRDPAFWEKPEEFYPDHFIPETVENRPTYAYIPFSGGLRSCAGRVLAIAAMRICLVRILQRYIIEANGKLKDFPITADISVRALKGYFVKIKHRHVKE